MSAPRRIVFMTGTRADFGKLKPLMLAAQQCPDIEVHVFATGMHMNPKYGRTVEEVQKCGFKNVFMYHNHFDYYAMDMILAKTIEGFSFFVKDLRPDLIVLHGDRVETLAGAIVGAINNVVTAHVEGGECSGTIDDSLRHAVSKLCHLHFVSNHHARERLMRMGEPSERIFEIGSPDVDVIVAGQLPTFASVKEHYEIPFNEYGLLLFHPVTTELDTLARQARELVDAVLASKRQFVVVYPNNDHGTDLIFAEYTRLEGNPRFRLFPSVRFESFLVLLREADFIMGNSSSGLMEAPYFGVPAINVGSRQQKRARASGVIDCLAESGALLAAMQQCNAFDLKPVHPFGDGRSAEKFVAVLRDEQLWRVEPQKVFYELAA